jgi:hypothetical protein
MRQERGERASRISLGNSILAGGFLVQPRFQGHRGERRCGNDQLHQSPHLVVNNQNTLPPTGGFGKAVVDDAVSGTGSLTAVGWEF